MAACMAAAYPDQGMGWMPMHVVTVSLSELQVNICVWC